MALTFFWRCEGTTLDATHDFSAADTTASANGSPAISATGAFVGSNGLVFDAVSERYDFTATSIVAAAEGAVGGWFQFPTSIPGTGNATLFFTRGTSFNDNISVNTVDSGADRRLRLSIGTSGGGGAVQLPLTTAQLSAGNWYFFLARWRSASNYRSIAVYDNTGTLIEEVVDSSTSFSANLPVDLTSIRFGDTTGATGTLYEDNLFVASTYDEPIQNNKTITSYTNYSAGGSTTVTPTTGAATLNGRTPTTSAFQNVRIREVLVNASGQAVASHTDIGLRVWYGGICRGAPDLSLNGMTTDANGTTSWSIATGTLAFNDPIFYVAQNSVSYSTYTAARLVPNYE